MFIVKRFFYVKKHQSQQWFVVGNKTKLELYIFINIYKIQRKKINLWAKLYLKHEKKKNVKTLMR